MRKSFNNYITSLIFIIGLIASLLISSVLISPHKNQTEGMFDSYADGIFSEPKNTVDVLIIGDSECYSSIIPLKMWEEYGITSYCCGTSAQLLSHSKLILNKAFQNQSPKIVLLETNAIFRKISFDRELINRAASGFSVFLWHNRWKEINKNNLNLTADYSDFILAKGYRFSIRKSPAKTSNYMKKSSKEKTIHPRNQRYLSEIKNLCDKNHAKLILISTPSVKNWNYKKHNSVQKISEKLNVQFIDMNMLREEIPIDWKTDSRDEGDHLNHFGAEKVTSYLGKYLFETGLLANHKNDGAYSAWNDALTDYQKTIAPAVSAKK